MGDGFYRSKDPNNSIKVLKENLQKKITQRTKKTQNRHAYTRLIEQGLTSPPTQYRLYGRRFFTGRKTQPTVSKYWRHTQITQLTEKIQ